MGKIVVFRSPDAVNLQAINDAREAARRSDDSAKASAAAAAIAQATSGAGFPTRAAFVNAVSSGYLDELSDGQVVMASGLAYRKSSGDTTISDIGGWMPNGVWQPGHFATLAQYVTAVAANLCGTVLPSSMTMASTIALESGSRLIGASGKETIKRDGTFNTITGTARDGVVVRDVVLNSGRDVGNTAGHLVSMTKANDVEFSGITVIGNGTRADGSGGGTGVLITATDGSAANKSRRARLLNSSIIGSATSGINIGWIWDNVDFGRVSGVYVENHLNGLGWAHELKHYSHFNVMSDLQADGANIAFGAGGETYTDDLGASFNAWSNLVARNARTGYMQSRGVGNLINGMVVDGTIPAGDARAEVFSIGLGYTSEGNSLAKQNVLKGIVGFGTRRFANIGGENNSVEIFAHTIGEMAKFQPGAKRNFIMVGHPGARNSVQTSVTNTGNAMRGADANVVFSPVTGEWLGTVSGHFKLSSGNSDATWNTVHHFRMESDTHAILAFGMTGSSGNNCGFNVAFPGDGNIAGFWFTTGATRPEDKWSIRGFGQGEVLTFDAAALFPTRDAGDASSRDRALGKADRRWKELFAATGTINTSDEREKTNILPINDAVLDAWGDVQMVAFQWLSAVAAKGELARVHFGLIAQQIRDAFLARGIDGTRYGLLCYDEWGELEEVIGDDGVVMQEARPAGNRWGIRADQCLFVEAAYQRRRSERIEARLAALETAIA